MTDYDFDFVFSPREEWDPKCGPCSMRFICPSINEQSHVTHLASNTPVSCGIFHVIQDFFSSIVTSR